MKLVLIGWPALSLLALAACTRQTPDPAPPTAVVMPASAVAPAGPASDPSLPPASVATNAPGTPLPEKTAVPPGMAAPAAGAGPAEVASAAAAAGPASGASAP
jgi:hypothetical protein